MFGSNFIMDMMQRLSQMYPGKGGQQPGVGNMGGGMPPQQMGYPGIGGMQGGMQDILQQQMGGVPGMQGIAPPTTPGGPGMMGQPIPSGGMPRSGMPGGASPMQMGGSSSPTGGGYGYDPLRRRKMLSPALR